MYIEIVFTVFLILILCSVLLKNLNMISLINIAGMFALLAVTLFCGLEVLSKGSIDFFNNFFYLDSLGFIQLLIINCISFISAIYSFKYINNEYKEGIISLNKAKVYYFLFICFVMSMEFIAFSNNLMTMWIGLEATTLATAFLIGFNQNKLSLEAAWKYIIICSTGIGLGLVGIVLFIYSTGKGTSVEFLNWTYLYSAYKTINIDITKIAFVFIFVGIGTKAGYAPMHTWLSDGHSEAPSPISALMSGVLLNLAIYVILRFYIIIKHVNGLENLRYLFVVFGCISLIISSFSILKQTNYKRLLAFSSVENIGIISLGIGFGGYFGVFGALLHSIAHAFGKTLLFLVSGNILAAYKTKRVDKIHCLIKTMPKNAVFLILGMLIITGTPPFASFFSEFKVLTAGVKSGFYISVGIFAICILIALAGFLNAFIKMIFVGEDIEYKKMKEDNQNILPVTLSFIGIVILSLTYWNCLSGILDRAVSIICR